MDNRFKLVSEVGEEIIQEDELKELLKKKKTFIAYDGFEPSGNMHVAQGILRAINVNKMTKAGAKFKMLVADWHGWANNKMDGDLKKIQKVGKYYIEMWKACGMDLKNVEFIWANDLVNNPEYWKVVMEIARNSTVKRIIRCGQIMGRTEGEVMQASQILYPCMQTADIFYLKADVCQLGMDQRKVNVLAREVGPKLGFEKPVVVSHHMLMGLGQPSADVKDAVERAIDMKMSKSKPDSAIFMTDSFDEIKRKMGKAYCPAKEVNENPVLEYAKYLVFEKFDSLKIERPAKFGGDKVYKSYASLEKDFVSGDLHPMDLKSAVAKSIDAMVAPVRKHFETNAAAKKLKAEVESFKVTR
ncbi:MAG: tyrosine--tRNA ligase [archaeon]